MKRRGEEDFGFTIRPVTYLDMAMEKTRFAHRFPDGLLGGKTYREVLRGMFTGRAVGNFWGSEDAMEETWIFCGLGDTGNFNDIDTNLHRLRRYSTVTLLAKFRGWSTSQPRRTEM